jgi:hypothetical protein
MGSLQTFTARHRDSDIDRRVECGPRFVRR